MKNTRPLVSCIMPTADRAKYIPLAVNYFLQQDYTEKELIIVDDGHMPIKSLLPEDSRLKYFPIAALGTIGAKRNYACMQARGEIIMHWDDDDYHATDWMRRQVDALISSESDICGIEHVHFFSPIRDTLWLGTALNRERANWLNGATLAYWKSFWKLNPFQDLQTGEDDAFLRSPGAKIYAMDYIDGFVALLHPHNTTVKYFENPLHKKQAADTAV